MARIERRGQRPRAHKVWATDPPVTLTDNRNQTMCLAEGWYEGWQWILFRPGVRDQEYPRIVYCQRPKGHGGEHAKRIRPSRFKNSGKWSFLHWP